MNHTLLHVKWMVLTILLMAQAVGLRAGDSGGPPVCPIINGDAISCVSQLEPYSAVATSGFTYSWGVSSGGVLANTTGPTTQVTWNNAGSEYVVLYATAVPGGAITSCTLYVTVYPQPSPAIATSFNSDCPDDKKEHDEDGNNEEDCFVVCENMTVNYWTDNVPGNTYSWIIVGGTPTTGTGSSISVTWGPAGSGTVVLTETAPGGCSETIEKCVKIIASPKADFLFNQQSPTSPLKICKGETVYFEDHSTGAAYWLWQFGDGGTSTLPNPAHPYDIPGTYYGSLTVKNECGCTDVIPFEIIVQDLASPQIGCISTVCLKDCAFYSVSNLGNCPGANVVWTIHGGQILNNPDPGSVNVVWDDNDGYIMANGYGLICAAVSGCPDLCDGEVCVRVPVIHQVTIIGPTDVCVGDPVTYSVPVQPGINEPGNPPDGVDFDWVISGGTIISSAPYSNSITVVWNTPGGGYVDLEVYENYLTDGDCKFDPDKLSVNVKPLFSISPSTATICLGDSQNFDAFPWDTFDWTITGPSGTTTTTVTGTFTATPTLPGVYVVTASSSSGVYCDIHPSAVLKVLDLPAAPTGTLSGETEICANTPYTYTISTPPPPGTVYVWSITGGTLFAGAGQTVTAQWGGVPPMELSVQTKYTQAPFCLSAPLTFSVDNYAPPASFVNSVDPLTVCVNETHGYYISGLTHYTNLVWTVNPPVAGSVVTGQGTPNIDVLFNTSSPATAQIICTATVCGSDISDLVTVTVNPIPAYAISLSDPTPCQNQAITLSVTPSTSITGYVWNFGDGTPTSTSASPSHAWSGAGSFPVSVALTTCGGQIVYANMTVNINPVPVSWVTANPGYVLCGSVTSIDLVASSQTFALYNWPASSTSGNTLTVTAPGAYTVVATDPGTGCSSTVTTNVVTCGSCTSTCTSATLPWTFSWVENCDSYTFTPNLTGALFQYWDFGDNTYDYSAGTSPVTHVYAHPGYYQVRLVTKDPINGCIMKVLQNITVKFKGHFTVDYNCNSGSMLTVLTDISEYLPPLTGSVTWSPVGSGTPYYAALAPGAQNVSMTVVVGSQTCTVGPTAITVPAMPVASFNSTAPACEGTPIQFNNMSTGGFTGFNWAFGDGATSSVFSPDRTYDAPPTSYNVTLTLTNNWGCTATASSPITVYEKGADPVITAAPSPQECEGATIMLSATNTLLTPSFNWYNQLAYGTSIGTGYSFNPAMSGTYGVEVTDGNGCVYNVASPPIVFMPPPYVQIVGETDYCPNDLIELSALIDNTNYSYQWGATTPMGSYPMGYWTTPDISHLGTMPGVYTFTVIITHTASGCSNTGTYTVVVHPGVTGLYISASGPCDPATLTANAVGAVSYNWNTGDVTPTTNAFQSGFYSVMATDAYGCTATATYTLEGRPNVENIMTGCYEYCEPVEWQSLNCNGCTSEWFLNGSSVGFGQTFLITQSGTYTVIVTSAAGCTAESAPIDISISNNPDLCHKCAVKVDHVDFDCVGIDPITGNPIYEVTAYIQNDGGALSGITATTTFGNLTIDYPVGGFLPGGGAITPVHGYLIWDGVNQGGCISFLGFLMDGCQVLDKCQFEWCGELPKCCDGECDLKAFEPQVTCIGNGYYSVNFMLRNNGCTLFNLFVKTGTGFYPVTPSTITTGTTAWYNVVIPGTPGLMNITICGYQFNGQRCCADLYLHMPECGETDCKMEVKEVGVTCLGVNGAGHAVYHFNLDVYGAPAGSSFYIFPNLPGLVTGVTSSCVGPVCNVQGNFEAFSSTGGVCFEILASTPPPNQTVCLGKICMHLPDCGIGRGISDRDNPTPAKAEKSAAGDFTLAPNPAFNVVTLTIDASLQANQIVISDMMGQTKTSVVPAAGRTTVDIHTLPSGIYNVTVTDTAGKSISKKLVVLR